MDTNKNYLDIIHNLEFKMAKFTQHPVIINEHVINKKYLVKK